MKKNILLFISFFLITFSAFGETPASSGNRIVLTQLGLKDKAMEAVLSEISDYIRMKPQGLRFPISKVMFKHVKGGLTCEIEGIDNSWANLFNYGEATFGYTVVGNRLYVIMGLAEEDIDINHLFYLTDATRSFSRSQMPPTGLLKRPKWIYDYVDGECTKITEMDLDILEK